MGKLAEHYLEHRPAAGRAIEIHHEALETVLQRLYELGSLAWPKIELSPEDFVAHVAARCPSLPDDDLRGADLFLAAACARGIPTALAAFDAAYLAQLPDSLARSGTPPHVGDEVRQLLGQKLLVGEPGRIADYQGRGSLANWVRAAAARAAANVARGQRRHGAAARAAAAEPGYFGADPELDFIKARFRPQFQAALREAVATLSARDRAILRLHFGERVTLNQIATSYNVHRVTVSRWLGEAQRAILDRTRLLLRERLDIGEAECDQLVAMVQSRIELTLTSLLRVA